MAKFIHNWFADFWHMFTTELKGVFTDGGVLLIFFVGGMGYPLLYNALYHNGVIADTPVAVVDDADCTASHRYIRHVDATRELRVAAHAATMEEAERLMASREVNGILYFPSDFGEKIAHNETARLSIYADMSSFLYYKNLLMGASFVMLDEIHQVEIERYSALGYTDEEVAQLVTPVRYIENNPYNKAFSYTIFFLSAALLMVVQQTMFYGMSLRAGSIREERHRSALYVAPPHHGRGMGRIVLGRGAAYWLPYMGIAMYVAFIVPALFHFPQRGMFEDIFVLLLFFVTDCVLFCQFWSSFFTHRETVIVLLLFMSPIAMFLTGFSWPVTAIPKVWQWLSYLFPSTFACRAYINLNSAGGDLATVRANLQALTLQGCLYYLAACLAARVEGIMVSRRHTATLEVQEA